MPRNSASASMVATFGVSTCSGGFAGGNAGAVSGDVAISTFAA
jgi:hypothetical protein